MALPASGAISFSDINTELGNGATATAALSTLTSATNPNINQAAPYSMSEFYSHTQVTVTIEPGTRIVVGTNGTTAAFDITTTEAWTISDDSGGWATPNVSSGTGNTTVTYTLTENNGGSTRFAIVTVSITGDSDNATIAQQAI